MEKECVIFERYSVDRLCTFMIIDPADGSEYGPFKNNGTALNVIKKLYPLDRLITFKWKASAAISFVPRTVEHWLRHTYAARGVKKTDLDAEIEGLRTRGSW